MVDSAKVRGGIHRCYAAAPATTRVAVYCRKSVADREQEFGSIDAQREAVEAYILSQRGEGWKALPERYDDDGFTGANTERPAFQRLLADVEAGNIDVVAVYKIDRLSRSLADFTRLVEAFEKHGVTFVSVTQQFNSTNSMGRLTLNILMSFAEFERETIAERTRDKMLASRRRGMWTGGRPMLGYDIVDKKLVINAEEAERVRGIFALYLEQRGTIAVVEELRARGWTTKSWTNQRGELVEGRPMTKTTLRTLLAHPIYVGRVRAGDRVEDGQHEAILDEATWASTQKVLESNRGRRGTSRAHHGNPTLLGGIVRCGACSAGMTRSQTTKGNRRYAYYVCQTALKEGAKACPESRVAVGDLEAFVVKHIWAIGHDPEVLAATISAAEENREAQRPAIEAELRRVSREARQVERDRKNVVDAIASGTGEASSVLIERLTDLDASLASLTQRGDQARAELAALKEDALDPAAIAAALEDLEPLWEELFLSERVRLIALLLERVEYHGARGEVALKFRPGAPRGVMRP